MFASRKMLAVLIAALALNLCFSFCAVPQKTSEPDAKAEHCHTEQEPSQTNEPEVQWQHCCDQDWILRAPVEVLPPNDADYQLDPLGPAMVRPALYVRRPFESSSPPPIASILRI